MSPDRVPLENLKANPANPKSHDLGAIIVSLRAHGFVDAPIVDDRTGLIIGGHGRVEALRAMLKAGEKPPAGIEIKAGKWLVPVQHARTRNDDQANALMVVLNRTVELGGWEPGALAKILTAAAKAGTIEFTGYDQDDLEKILKDTSKQPGEESEPIKHCPTCTCGVKKPKKQEEVAIADAIAPAPPPAAPIHKKPECGNRMCLKKDCSGCELKRTKNKGKKASLVKP